MPQSVLSANRVLELLSEKVGRPELEELLFHSKAELAHWEEDALTIEATPDRLDLLSEGGLALYLQGALGLKKGPVPIPDASSPFESVSVAVDATVRPLRPFLAAAVLTAPSGVALDAGLLGEAVRFQELLHATVGLDRRAASLGIYPIERLTPPFRYAAEPLRDVRFLPLDGTAEVSGDRFFDEHPMARTYGGLGRTDQSCLTLRDAEGRVLSLPPILNSRNAGETRIGDRTVLVESTGTREVRVEESVGLLLLPFVARGWGVRPVRVEYPERTDTGLSCVSPRRLPFSAATLQQISGLSFSSGEVEGFIERARLGARKAPEGWWVETPPWRSDLQTSVDLAEEVLLVRGLDEKEALHAPSSTRGRPLPESRFRAQVRALFLGLGYVELRTPVLVSERLATLVGRAAAIPLVNPVSELFSRTRDSLLVSLVTVLERNVRYGYPQRFSDVGPAVVPDRSDPSGARTRYRAAAVLASESAGFADAAALVDYVVGAFGALGVREPAEVPGSIPGRSARLRIAGEAVAEMGELAPTVLNQVRLPVPVAWAEIDLTALAPLVRRPETV